MRRETWRDRSRSTYCRANLIRVRSIWDQIANFGNRPCAGRRQFN